MKYKGPGWGWPPPNYQAGYGYPPQSPVFIPMPSDPENTSDIDKTIKALKKLKKLAEGEKKAVPPKEEKKDEVKKA